MAFGPLLPSSIYVGGGLGNLTEAYYVGTTATGTGALAGYSALEGVGVVGALNADSLAVLQFNIPPTGVTITGTLKLRLLAMANATAGIAKLDIIDGVTSPNTSIGASNFTTEAGGPTITKTWTGSAGSTADNLFESKVTLTAAPAAGQIVTVILAFRTSGWTLAQASVWQASLIWE
jgi:hypothetical protein